MTKLHILALATLVLGPAAASAAPLTAPKPTAQAKPSASAKPVTSKTQLSPKATAAIKLGPQNKLAPSLSKVQLGAKIKEFGKVQPVGGEFEVQGIQIVSPTRMRVDGGTATMTLHCPTFVTGFADDFPATFARDIIKHCGSAGAEVSFKVQAGRVYVVECQTNNIPWRMTRTGGSTADVRTTGSTSNPTFVFLAETTGFNSVTFDLSLAHDYISQYQIGKCQIGWIGG